MKNVARPKQTAPRSRVATPEELAEDRRRYLSSKPSLEATAPSRAPIERDAGPGAAAAPFSATTRCQECGDYLPCECGENHAALRASKPSIAALRAGLTETQELPAIPMAELVAANDNGEALS